MIKRGYLQISFAWLFAIIVGMIILFIAIYAVVKFMGIGQTANDAETAERIGSLLNPLETGFEDFKATTMILPQDTRIYTSCDEEGNFGQQKINVSQKSFGKWTQTGIDVIFLNKYIFSEKEVEGKKFFLLSVPFRYPFKVSNMIILTPESKNYCFINAPENIEREITQLIK